MSSLSPTAMILAAGLGTRMRPLTLETPKPLLKVGGRTMLDLALDKLIAAGITRVVVNTFYLAGQIEAHLTRRHDIEIIISRETELLDTGGGIKNALRHFDNMPFFALNADLPWADNATPSLTRMKAIWNAAQMDAMLLLMSTQKARGFAPGGNFNMDKAGRVQRKNMRPPFPYVMISAQILKPESFAAIGDKIFSNRVIWEAAETQGKLYGIEHSGTCYHVGTPEDLEKANALVASGQGW